MPQPAEVGDLVEEILKLYRAAQQNITEQLARVATDPNRVRRARRLRELRRTVAAELNLLETSTADWLTGAYPRVYELGGTQGAASIGTDFGWTQSATDAVQVLAGDTFDDVLAATTHVRADVKAWIRQESRRQTTLSLIEGRTAEQAARELVKAAAGDLVDQLGGPVGVIRYADGSYRRLDDYADMLLRTKTAQAFNAGTLNTLQGFGVGYVEVLDGTGCGWTSHDDGDTANGSIRTVKAAAEHPLAHPRCRRSFIGRPDVATDDEAKKAKRSTTEEQNADQAQAELDRAERIDRARRARTPRGVRPPRQTRPKTATRTPRAPRAAAKTPAPAVPAPAARAGVDPADTFTRVPSTSATHGKPVRDSLEAIRSVHRAPDGMTAIPVESDSATEYAGAFKFTRATVDDPSRPVRINLSRRSNAPEATLAHEYGHFLDHNGIGSSRSTFATTTRADDQLLDEWRTAIDRSDAVTTLRTTDWGGRAQQHVDHYMLMPQELWARSYAQWIATRSGNQAMIDQVASMAVGRLPYQWDPADFEPIATAFDRIFDSLGLLA